MELLPRACGLNAWLALSRPRCTSAPIAVLVRLTQSVKASASRRTPAATWSMSLLRLVAGALDRAGGRDAGLAEDGRDGGRAGGAVGRLMSSMRAGGCWTAGLALERLTSSMGGEDREREVSSIGGRTGGDCGRDFNSMGGKAGGAGGLARATGPVAAGVATGRVAVEGGGVARVVDGAAPVRRGAGVALAVVGDLRGATAAGAGEALGVGFATC